MKLAMLCSQRQYMSMLTIESSSPKRTAALNASTARGAAQEQTVARAVPEPPSARVRARSSEFLCAPPEDPPFGSSIVRSSVELLGFEPDVIDVNVPGPVLKKAEDH